MKPIRLTIALGLMLVAGVALAKEDPTNPVVLKRVEAMRAMKAQVTLLGDMAVGKAPYDAALAEETAAAFSTTADLVPVLFDAEEDDPASDALPDIWFNRGEFNQKADRLYKAAMGLDWKSAGGLAASMNAVNAACKDCHGRFKM